MPRFILKLLLFALPVACYGLVAIGMPYYAGEFTPLRQVAAEQAASPVASLYGRAYRDDFVAYKLLSTQLRRANILALGSSRVWSFRAGLFNKAGASFYNAGGGANTISDLGQFVQALAADQAPQVLIVGLDQDWFDPAHVPTLVTSPAEALNQPAMDDQALLNTGRSAMVDWLTGRWSVLQLLTRKDPITQDHAVGIRAIMTGDGFRKDGSRQFGHLLSSPTATADRLAETRRRIEISGDRFEYADQFSPTAVAKLGTFLDECQARGITVIGFSPPYAPSIYAEMAASAHYGYIPKLGAELGRLFAAKGLAYFDFSDGHLPGITDDNFIDGFHGSEIVYSQMYLQMLEAQPDLLGQYSEAAPLVARLQQPRMNNLTLFDNDAVP